MLSLIAGSFGVQRGRHRQRHPQASAVEPGSPAASNGVRPGDVIVSVNDAPPFADGIFSDGVMNLLFGPYPQAGRVSVRCSGPPPAAPGRWS
jgi:S1-C subfamily serine protease